MSEQETKYNNEIAANAILSILPYLDVFKDNCPKEKFTDNFWLEVLGFSQASFSKLKNYEPLVRDDNHKTKVARNSKRLSELNKSFSELLKESTTASHENQICFFCGYKFTFNNRYVQVNIHYYTNKSEGKKNQERCFTITGRSKSVTGGFIHLGTCCDNCYEAAMVASHVSVLDIKQMFLGKSFIEHVQSEAHSLRLASTSENHSVNNKGSDISLSPCSAVVIKKGEIAKALGWARWKNKDEVKQKTFRDIIYANKLDLAFVKLFVKNYIAFQANYNKALDLLKSDFSAGSSDSNFLEHYQYFNKEEVLTTLEFAILNEAEKPNTIGISVPMLHILSDRECKEIIENKKKICNARFFILFELTGEHNYIIFDTYSSEPQIINQKVHTQLINENTTFAL